MDDIVRRRLEWFVNSVEGELFPEELREGGKDIGTVVREAVRSLLKELDGKPE